MVESGLFSADDTSSSSEDYFNLSDPEATADNICFTCHKVSIPIDTMSNSILPSASPSPSRAHPSARSFSFFIKVIILFLIIGLQQSLSRELPPKTESYPLFAPKRVRTKLIFKFQSFSTQLLSTVFLIMTR